METVRLFMFAEVVRAALLWASIALVARGQRNRFASALAWTAVLLGVQQVAAVAFDSTLGREVAWFVPLLAVLLAGYRLKPLRAIAATVLVFAGWLGGCALLALIVAGNDTAKSALVTGVPLAILVGYGLAVAARRRRLPDTSPSR